MAILIKDMDKPQYCYECPFHTRIWNGEKAQWYCERLRRIAHDYDGHNNSDCPLIWLSDNHGDLIDRDAFIKFIKENWPIYDQWIVGVLDARPTVIPAKPPKEEA